METRGKGRATTDDPQIPAVTYSGAPTSLPTGEGSLSHEPTPCSHAQQSVVSVLKLIRRESTRDSPPTPTLHLPTHKLHEDLPQQICAPVNYKPPQLLVPVLCIRSSAETQVHYVTRKKIILTVTIQNRQWGL